MKLIATALFALALSILPAAAADKKLSKTAVKLPKSAKVVAVKAPFENHWSANSWESDSQENFWHARTPVKKPAGQN